MKSWIFDIETNAKDPQQVSQVWCVCLLDPESRQELVFQGAGIYQALDQLGVANRLIGHNISQYDLPVLERVYRFHPVGQVVDTLVLSRLLFNGLSDKADRYGRHGVDAWGKRLGCHKGDWSDFSTYHPDMVDYCLQDCRVVQKLREHFMKLDCISNQASELELEYEAFLRSIERNGFSIDISGVEQLQAKLVRRLDRIQGYLDQHFPPTETETERPQYYTYQGKQGDSFPQMETKTALERWLKDNGIRPRDVEIIAGPPQTKISHFNANSPQQVIQALRSLGWDGERENSSGSVNTSETVLWNSGLTPGRLIAVYRGYTKLHSFANQWLKHQHNGRLHPCFIGNRAATGRSACKAPNIQQIPSTGRRRSGMRVLDKYERHCRQLFKPQDGYVLVGADLAGIEVRLLGHRLAPYDGGAFAELVASGQDIHQRNAEQIGISRDHAKTVLYGSMYGQGASSLSESIKTGQKEAQRIIAAFTTGIPGFAEMKRNLLDQLKPTGRIRLIDGRQIQVGSEHKALNYAIQGDAAILMKHWAIESAERLAGTSYTTLAVVHDEIQSECLPGDVDTTIETVRKTATDVGRQLGFDVEITADSRQGCNWHETH